MTSTQPKPQDAVLRILEVQPKPQDAVLRILGVQPKPQDAVLRILGVKLKYLAAAFMLASLLFAHGCHRHDDNELFTNWFSLSASPVE